MIPCNPVAFKLSWLREQGKHPKSFDKYLKNKNGHNFDLKIAYNLSAVKMFTAISKFLAELLYISHIWLGQKINFM